MHTTIDIRGRQDTSILVLLHVCVWKQANQARTGILTSQVHEQSLQTAIITALAGWLLCSYFNSPVDYNGVQAGFDSESLI